MAGMSNWCLGCKRDIASGDYCFKCGPLSEEEEAAMEARYLKWLESESGRAYTARKAAAAEAAKRKAEADNEVF